MQNKHVTRFGYPTSNSGALYYITDQEGLVQMAIDIEIARININGFPITPLIFEQLSNQVRRLQSNYNNCVTSIGVPLYFKSLLGISEKSEIDKLCRY